MEAAKLMIYEAKEAGIHAVKFQTYKAGTLAAKDSPYYWDITEEPTTSQYQLFKSLIPLARQSIGNWQIIVKSSALSFSLPRLTSSRQIISMI